MPSDDSFQSPRRNAEENIRRLEDVVHLSGQHYNQCDKATNKDQAREREEREK